MAQSYKFYAVDDDAYSLEIVSRYLRDAGYGVSTSTSSTQALSEIVEQRPDCVITDLMMPGLDGLELCSRIRKEPALANTKVVVVSGKAYEFDRRRAREMGANGYVTKPINREGFLSSVQRILEDKIVVDFWGVRGTLPVPGPKTVKFGGNTSCVTMSFPDESYFIFDAGSGIRTLGDALMRRGGRVTAKIFISHPHWDHINALPFFTPLYIRGNEFEILGAAHGDRSVRDLIKAQMDDVFFPITLREFGASLSFRDLREETIEVGSIQVKTMLLSHPGYCLGFRMTYKGRSVCYITDNELYLPTMPQYNPHYVERLIDFVRDADVVITDTTYTDEIYPQRVDFGHSSVSQVVDFVHRAKVKELYLFHHDPSETDDDVERKHAAACKALEKLGSSTRCIAPPEGSQIRI